MTSIDVWWCVYCLYIHTISHISTIYSIIIYTIWKNQTVTSLPKFFQTWVRVLVHFGSLRTLPFAYSPGATCCCHLFHCSSAQQITPSSAILKISKEHIQTIRSTCSCYTRKLSWARAALTGWVGEWRMFLHKTVQISASSPIPLATNTNLY